jgi:GNAT superfamily N-acetyltransferase
VSWGVRLALPEDADAIAQVHWDSWVATYTGVFPQASFDAYPLGTRREVWRREAAGLTDRRLFVAASGAEVLGFANEGPYRRQSHEAPGQGAGEAELMALYLRPGQQRRGIGRALWQAVLDRARADGHPALRLWVIAGNPAERFYAAMGALPIGEHVFDAHGTPVREICCRIEL